MARRCPQVIKCGKRCGRKHIRTTNKRIQKDSPLTASRGKVPPVDYLDIMIDYRQNGKVRFSILDYIKQILEELPHAMYGTAKTPTANHLFNVNYDAKKLPEDKAQLFHHVRAKLLFLCRRT